MSEQAAPERIWSGIDIFKVTAGTLAAVAAAVVGSFLGVAGTLIGAAVASVVGSIGTEVFAKSLNRGYTRLRGTRPGEVAATPLADAATPADAAIPVHGEAATHAVPVTGAPHLPVPPGRARPRWRQIVLAAGAFFVLAMGGIFAVEAVAGEPLAALVGSSDAKGTSFNPQPDPVKESTPGPSPSPEESTGPSTDEPSSEPTVIPTIPPTTGENSPAPEATTPAPETTGNSTGDGSVGNGSVGNGSTGNGSIGDGSTDLVPDGTP